MVWVMASCHFAWEAVALASPANPPRQGPAERTNAGYRYSLRGAVGLSSEPIIFAGRESWRASDPRAG
jgi:hypothetical protein